MCRLFLYYVYLHILQYLRILVKRDFLLPLSEFECTPVPSYHGDLRQHERSSDRGTIR